MSDQHPEPTPEDPIETGDQKSVPIPSPRLLEFLVCPVTRTTLELSDDRLELISRVARLAFPIRDGIPMLTKDAARDLHDDELPRGPGSGAKP